MTLLELSGESLEETGSGTGFLIKSLAHPDRKFTVLFKTGGGKFVITRLDTGVDYLVDGSSDRYEFAIPLSRVLEVKAEISELTEQATVIASRLATLKGEIVSFQGVC